MQLDLNQIKELLASLDNTDISELKLKGENFELLVRRGSEPVAAPVPRPAASPAPVGSVSPVALPALSPPEPVSSVVNPNWIEIRSPMVGTFYEAAAPGEAAFVQVGDRIKVGQTVCILEAMKLMNELESEISGEVVEILVENGQPVEFDQPLVRVLP
ncbi:MAG: acetyl-CoA carboxylase biotin carboxyl carrier protein [Synechococcales cyanobacterium RU_4_20]|nr:acetyl-CoA carboxylase biotin carboxyl carrier protein [Synechococcales cyanobacterium RU_4_20]NJR69978.1 acetyl-CoA carboxylase biotin carboxyl carrier protein [Synechococcales cyanobacterium CRU_2_2]